MLSAEQLLFQFTRITVAKQPEIRRPRFLGRMLAHLFHNPASRRGAERSVVRKMHPAEEINAGSECFDKYFIGMKCEFEPYSKKRIKRSNPAGISPL